MSALHVCLLIVTILYTAGLILFALGLFFPNREKSGEKPFVSAIIAARNEEKNIAGILSDLGIQTYPPNRFEVIVADDHSTDDTSRIVMEAAEEHPNIGLIKIEETEENFTPKKNAVHQAILRSRGEIILTTDADCRVLPTWIESMVSCFTPDTGMVVGFSQLGMREDGQSLFERLQALDFLSLMAAAQGALNLGIPLAASGQNLAYRRKAFDDAGGFRRIASRVSGDDVLLVQLVRKHTKWKLRFNASAEGFNTSQVEHTLRDFFHQRMRWASNGAYQWVLNKPFFLYVIVTFLLNSGLLLGIPFGLFSGNSGTPWICLGLKAASEILILVQGCRVYRRWDLLPCFPIWVLSQIPYVVIVGLMGTWGQFNWSGRSYKEKVPRA